MTKVMATKITRDVLESYLNCKTKAHLKLAGRLGSISDYEGLLVASRQEARHKQGDYTISYVPNSTCSR